MADSITCLDCHSVVEDSFVYCGKCGVKLERENFNYSLFWKGIWVWKNSGIFGKISLHRNELWTLKTRLKSYGLTRKLCSVDEALVRRIIREELDGPGSMEGYQSVWHTLQLEGICVARHVVEQMMREMDPVGCERRRAKRLKRRTFFTRTEFLLAYRYRVWQTQALRFSHLWWYRWL